VADRDGCDERIDPWYERSVRSAFAERLAAHARSEWLGGFAGAYDYLTDWNPVLGWAPEVAGLYLARGSGHGFELAPAVAEVAADEIIGRKSRIDVTSLRPTRFEAESTCGWTTAPAPRA
jgi:glycine/D-amino acid oxidase-like deaminating enzyme